MFQRFINFLIDKSNSNDTAPPADDPSVIAAARTANEDNRKLGESREQLALNPAAQNAMGHNFSPSDLHYHPTQLEFFTAQTFAALLYRGIEKDEIYLDAIDEAQEMIQALNDHETGKAQARAAERIRGNTSPTLESVLSDSEQKVTFIKKP